MAEDLKQVKAKHEALKIARSPWVPDWIQLAKHFLPRKSRWLEGTTGDEGKGALRSDILDSTGIYARRVASGGMHGGMTSPARPWFKLTLQDEDLAQHKSVRPWLDETQKRMRNLFSRSNFYQAIHNFYDELITFATDFVFLHPDPRYALQFNCLTAGEYCVDTDTNGRIDTVFRLMRMTARNMQRMFGEANCSQAVNQANTKAETSLNMFDVVHAVFPREDRTVSSYINVNMPFASCYFEPTQMDKFLRISGYNNLPGFGARWDVTGSDVYGGGPCMDALGDVRMLQSVNATYYKQEHKRADPPMVGPAGIDSRFLPNSYTPIDTANDRKQVYPAYQVQPDSQGMLLIIQDIRNRIREGLYNDLFKMLAYADKDQMTATEVAERHEEKLLQLGPVLERLHAEAFIPLIDLVFYHMHEMDMLTPWPEELDNMPLKVDFISLLAQAQKLVSTGAVDKFCGFIAGNAETMPEVVDVLDIDTASDEYADYLGLPANMIRSLEDRKARREQKIKAQQAQQAADLAAQGSTAVRNLGSAKLNDNRSALDAVLGTGGE